MADEQICPRCGGKVINNDRFCPKCGAPRETEEAGPQIQQPDPQRLSSKEGSGTGNFLLIFFAALLVGMAIGWIRYWIGFCVIFQGAASAGLIIWAFQALRTSPPGGALITNGQAWGWSLIFIPVFWATQIAGLGMAQPWFEPMQYFHNIIMGTGAESVFGITRTTAFSGGFSGLMWVFCNALDALIMFVILAIGIRDDQSKTDGSDESADEDNEKEDAE